MSIPKYLTITKDSKFYNHLLLLNRMIEGYEYINKKKSCCGTFKKNYKLDCPICKLHKLDFIIVWKYEWCQGSVDVYCTLDINCSDCFYFYYDNDGTRSYDDIDPFLIEKYQMWLWDLWKDMCLFADKSITDNSICPVCGCDDANNMTAWDDDDSSNFTCGSCYSVISIPLINPSLETLFNDKQYSKILTQLKPHISLVDIYDRYCNVNKKDSFMYIN